MKTLLYLISAILLTACPKEKSTAVTMNTTTVKTGKTTSNSKKSKPYIKITFNDGLFKGTHTFMPPKGDYLSQINVEFYNGVTSLGSSKIITENGIQIHNISRGFLGEAKVGSHTTKKYTAGCGHLNFIDLKNNQSYKRIDGDFTGCTETEITKVTPWEKGTVKFRRQVAGKFSDTVTFEVTKDDDTKETFTTKVTVEFLANQSKF